MVEEEGGGQGAPHSRSHPAYVEGMHAPDPCPAHMLVKDGAELVHVDGPGLPGAQRVGTVAARNGGAGGGRAALHVKAQLLPSLRPQPEHELAAGRHLCGRGGHPN